MADARAALSPITANVPAAPPPTAKGLGTMTLTASDGPHVLELLATLGEGGYGTVYRARSSLHGDVAVKCIGHGGDTNDIADIEREVAIHERLCGADDSPFVRLLHHECESVRSILVLELVRGVELDDVVARSPSHALSEEAARPLFAQLADALAHCHELGVAHLDVQPRNALVGADSKLTLIDYGSADFLDEGGRVAERGALDNYRAPERQLVEHALIDDERFLGAPADVFSAGCTLFYMLRGREPYDWDEAVEAGAINELLDYMEEERVPFDIDIDSQRRRVGGAAAVPPRALGAGAKELIIQMLQWTPEKRPTMHAARRHAWAGAGAGSEKDDGAAAAAAEDSADEEALLEGVARLSVEAAPADDRS